MAKAGLARQTKLLRVRGLLVIYESGRQIFVPTTQTFQYRSRTLSLSLSLSELLEELSDLLATGDGELGRTHLLEHTLAPSLLFSKPPPTPPPFTAVEEVERLLSELLAQGRIEPSNTSWSSPITLARKHDGSHRLRIDYRRLNAVNVKDVQPLREVRS